MTEPFLEIAGLDAGYGALQILHQVDLAVAPGERVLVFGPNGAGKSTLMKAIFGLIRPMAGVIRWQGQEIGGSGPERIVRLGIGYAPQLENIFPSLTIEENLEVGGLLDRQRMRQRIAEMFGLFPALADRRRQLGRTLSGGERQMLAMARALMLRPRLLLLDEPTAGLAPALVVRIFELITAINQQGTAILLVEQNARQALPFVDRAYVLEMGRNRFEGSPAALLDQAELARLYLGEEAGEY